MTFKDHFSAQASSYAEFRPQYPAAMYQYIASVAERHDLAWDCATGNGQVASGLVNHFAQVVATDASHSQIANAFTHDRIQYETGPAEKTSFGDQSIDLITVGQALHWFDQNAFFEEARRVLRPAGVLAIWCYGLFEFPERDDKLTKAFSRFYIQAEQHWPPERRMVNEAYANITFPFRQLKDVPEFSMTCEWTLPQFTGYLKTWSATRRLIAANGEQTVSGLMSNIEQAWKNPSHTKTIRWPLTLRINLL